jgi:hypothetical protein
VDAQGDWCEHRERPRTQSTYSRNSQEQCYTV